MKIQIRPNTTDTKVINEIFKRKVYEKPSMDFMIESDDFWFDLGSNIGCFALLVLSKGCDFICYEPEESNYELLMKNLSSNYSSNKWSINKQAVSNYDGISDLYLCRNESNKYRHTLSRIRGRCTIKVNVVNFKDIIQQFPVNAIKMDIEGEEIKILESMNLLDWKKSKVNKFVFEYSFDRDSSISRFMRIIDNLQLYFDLVHYTKVNEFESNYKYFPAQTIVFCKKY